MMCFAFSRVLGVTALWMILPCMVALQRKDLTFCQVLFCLHLLILCMASVVFWYHPMKGTRWHQLDRYCAATFIFNAACYLIVVHSHTGTVLLWLTLTMCAAWGSHLFWLQGSSWCHLLMHLVFRYVAYWGAHAILVSDIISLNAMMLITRMYLLHITWYLICTSFIEHAILLGSNKKTKRVSYVLHCLMCMQNINSTSKLFLY